jgi:preprotein translocase subunit SecG
MTYRKNYLKIHDPKLNKVFWWIVAAFFASAIAILILIVVQFNSYDSAQEGLDLCSLIPGYLPFIEVLCAIYFIFFIAILTIMIYVFATNKENESIAKKKSEADSPLIGVTKEQQTKIIEMLKSVAMPAPNKQTINQARTAKLLQALTALGVIDSNRDSKHLMAWIEYATGYSAGETRVFNQARNAVKERDSEVKKFQEQITQIIEK